MGGGGGGYISGITIDDSVLEKILVNTSDDNLHYTFDEHTGLKNYMVGYLFGVETPSGQTMNIDAHDMQFGIRHGEGVIAEFGPIMWQGQDVTEAFWSRVAFMSERALDQEARGHATFTLPEYDASREEALEQIPVSYTEDLSPPQSAEAFLAEEPLDGLVSYQGYDNTDYVSDSIVRNLRTITLASQAIAIQKSPENALIKFSFRDRRQLSDGESALMKALGKRYNNTSSGVVDFVGEDAFYVNDEVRQMYLDPPTVDGLERMLGKQGERVDNDTVNAHVKLSFDSREQLEGAVATLTDPTARIVNPLDITIKGNHLSITGRIHTAPLREVAARVDDISTPSLETGTDEMRSHSSAKRTETSIPEFDYGSATGLEDAVRFGLNSVMPEEMLGTLSIRYDYEKQAVEIRHERTDDSVTAKVQDSIIREGMDFVSRVVRWNDAELTVEETTPETEGITCAYLPYHQVPLFAEALHNRENNGRLLSYIFRTFETAAFIEGTEQSTSAGQSIVLRAESGSSLVSADNFPAYQGALITESLVEAFRDAADNGDIDSVRDLLERGVDPAEGIYQAARGGHTDTLRLLIEHGADVNNGIEPGEHAEALIPLHLAAKNGHADTVAYLLENGANAAQHSSSRTALMLAVEHGHDDVVDLLLPHGPHVQYQRSYGVYDFMDDNDLIYIDIEEAENLFYAIRNVMKTLGSREDIEEALLAFKEYQTDDRARTVANQLYEQFAERDIDLAFANIPRFMPERDADIPDHEREAIALRIAKKLIEAGANVNAVDFGPPVYEAYTANMPKLASFIAAQIGFDVNTPGAYGDTALMSAAEDLYKEAGRLSKAMQRTADASGDVGEEPRRWGRVTKAIDRVKHRAPSDSVDADDIIASRTKLRNIATAISHFIELDGDLDAKNIKKPDGISPRENIANTRAEYGRLSVMRELMAPVLAAMGEQEGQSKGRSRFDG
jgi:hypothetical protein